MAVDCAVARVRFRCRRLTSLVVLTLALAWTATVVSQTSSATEGEECTGGIPGYEASGVCCILACGRCGGDGCGDIEGTTDDDCCTSDIIKNNQLCSQTGMAPCVIDTSPTAAPTTSPPVGAPQLFQPTVLPTSSTTKAPLNATPDPNSQPTTIHIPSLPSLSSPTPTPMTTVSLSPTVTPVLTLSPTPAPSGSPTRSPTPIPLEAPTPSPMLPPTLSPTPSPTLSPTLSPMPPPTTPTSPPIPTPTPTQESSSPSQQTPPFTTIPPSSAPPVSTDISTPVPSVFQLPTPSPTTSLPTMFPPSSAPTVETLHPSNPMCSNGLPGYENSVVCCPVECGQCGGSGCENILETVDNPWSCCSDLVIIQGKPCEETEEAPCFMNEGVSSATTTRVRGGLAGSVILATIVATRVWWLGP